MGFKGIPLKEKLDELNIVLMKLHGIDVKIEDEDLEIILLASLKKKKKNKKKKEEEEEEEEEKVARKARLVQKAFVLIAKNLVIRKRIVQRKQRNIKLFSLFRTTLHLKTIWFW